MTYIYKYIYTQVVHKSGEKACSSGRLLQLHDIGITGTGIRNVEELHSRFWSERDIIVLFINILLYLLLLFINIYLFMYYLYIIICFVSKKPECRLVQKRKEMF